MQRPDCNISFTNALIAVGSNGSSEVNLSFSIVRDAVDRVVGESGGKAVVSRFYRTPAFPAGAGPDFVNAAFAIDWSGSAEDLLALLHRVEVDAGRTRTRRWEARVLDLDLLALGEQVRPDAETQTAWRTMPLAEAATRAPGQLVLPHPRLQERGFVLVPLADVAPDWRHPLTGDTVQQMLDRLPAADLHEIVPLDPD
ncbi:2-amino-4-hydroxy-6-hydroxymethyldihydropteridine diphosphokinase [Nioella nitratireducens]|uniref:2-amino-4-hydroxy-6- hydroxymethyldihydropteridine diphosphokinase n=1 Tax=Nioella nitratireducens TaxID=1287720 RepID=UPI000A96CD1B|nr:2-amino-4-hydroxy-6-hydroxymethyldihydropteridine diphosphokinase [Nioella nitratireducens]